MTDVPPGWHPDPRGRHQHRYWDGTQWTDHVADDGVTATDPVSRVQPPEPPAEDEPPPLRAQPAGAAASSLWASPDAPAASGASDGPASPDAGEPGDAAAGGEDAAPAADDVRPPGDAPAPEDAPPLRAGAGAPDDGPGRSPELATLLSVVLPGSGHLYLGRQSPVAWGLLGATAVAVVLAYFSFALFLVGLVLWAAAAALALTDLRGGLAGVAQTRLSAGLVGWVLLGAGAALVIALVLPWYHVNIDINVRGFGGISGGESRNFSAFEAFGVLDVVLLVIGAAAAVAGLAAVGRGPISADELPAAMPLIVAGGGLVALVGTLYRLFSDPVPGFVDGVPGGVIDISVGRGPGALLALAASIAIVAASANALTGARARPAPAAPPPAAPPPAA